MKINPKFFKKGRYYGEVWSYGYAGCKTCYWRRHFSYWWMAIVAAKLAAIFCDWFVIPSVLGIVWKTGVGEGNDPD